MTDLNHPVITAFAAALRKAGMASAADNIRVLADETRTAVLAAQALAVPVGAIANSLIFRARYDTLEAPLLALTSGAHRADTAKLAQLIGAAQVSKADASFVREHTGQPIGGVGPIGHPQPIRTVVDTALAAYDVVWAAAGHPRTVFPITFEALLTLTNGVAAEVSVAENNASYS